MPSCGRRFGHRARSLKRQGEEVNRAQRWRASIGQRASPMDTGNKIPTGHDDRGPSSLCSTKPKSNCTSNVASSSQCALSTVCLKGITCAARTAAQLLHRARARNRNRNLGLPHIGGRRRPKLGRRGLPTRCSNCNLGAATSKLYTDNNRVTVRRRLQNSV